LFAIATSITLFPPIAKAIKREDEITAKQYLKKASYVLMILLLVSTIIGIIFDQFIIKLLFQRGEFNVYDTTQTSLILTMYLIGLIPFGLSKIFLLWFYAKQEQSKAVKITSISLIFNIIASLILITPFGAMGLALASSLSGFLLFYLTLKKFKEKVSQ